MRVLRPMRLVFIIALVVQGLFFSIHAAEEIKAKNPSLSIWEKPRYENAKLYAERGLLDKAIPELKEIAGLYPDNVEAHAYLGWAYSQKGLISDAVEEFQKVLQINPDLQRMPFNFPMVKDTPAVAKEFIAHLEDIIDWTDGFSGAHAVLGFYYVQQGMLGDALNEYKKVLKLERCEGKESISGIDQAIKEYEDVIRLKPDCVEAYIKLACAHADKDMLDMSIADMKKAISIEPERGEAHVYLACFYARKLMLDKALNELNETKKIRDSMLETSLAEAGRCIATCMFENAISAAQDAIRIYPRDKRAYRLLATAYNKNGEIDKAIGICKEFLCRYPDDVHAYAFLGWIYVQCDLFKEAKDLVERAIRIEPENAEIQALMAFLYVSQDQLHEAVAMCNKTIDTMSVKNDRVSDYGWIRGNVPSIEQKFREVMDVLEVKPDYTEAYLCLGWLYSKNGEAERAINSFRKILELTSDSYKAHVYLGNAYVQRGQIKDALNEYNMALHRVSATQLQ